MAANLGEVALTLLAGSAAQAIFSLPTLSIIGGITVDTTIEEDYEDRIEVTEHPVEAGTNIADHSFKRPMELRLRCGWSDSNLQSSSVLFGEVFLGGNVQNVSSTFTGGAMAASDYIAGIYAELLSLQESRQPFQVVTGMRLYSSMVLYSLRVRRDQATRFVLMVEAEFRQVIIATTTAAALPSQANQANPASTAAQVGAGSVTPGAATPAPGGSFPPVGNNSWQSSAVTVRVGPFND